jgi:hypothetical protein
MSNHHPASQAGDFGPWQNEDTRTKESRHFDPHREPYDPNRVGFRRPLANLLPSLPGLPLPGLAGLAGSYKTYAPSPVWAFAGRGRQKCRPVSSLARYLFTYTEIRISTHPKIRIDKQAHFRLFIWVPIHHFA